MPHGKGEPFILRRSLATVRKRVFSRAGNLVRCSFPHPPLDFTMPMKRFAICLLVLLVGCPASTKPLPPLEPAEPVGPVRLLVVDDAPLARVIEREWTARTGNEIKVKQISAAELVKATSWEADAIIYPPALMGELVESGRIIPIADDSLNAESFARRGILPLARQYEMRWGERNYAIPLASPRLTLLYRSDLLEKLGVQSPTTWEAYQQLAARLHDRSNLAELAPPVDQPWSGTVEPMAGHWSGEMLLARAASSTGRHGQLSALFDFTSLDAQLDSPPFVDALTNMQQTAASQPADALEIDPAEARNLILAGHCGMALTWLPAPPDREQQESMSAAAYPLGIASLPGSDRVYLPEKEQWQVREEGLTTVPLIGFGGRVGSVTAQATQRQAALDLLLLIAGPEWSTEVARHSSEAHPFRRQHLEQPAAWLPLTADRSVGTQFTNVVEQLEGSPLVLISPRLPGRARYLEALRGGVKRAVIGESSPEEALTEAAIAWDTITEELGPEKQRSALRQSAGIGF
jgi:multiple sugar transport system substrate-binding protein